MNSPKNTHLIYKDNLVEIQSSLDCAVPGFYTLRPTSRKKSITEFSEVEFRLFSYMQKQLRTALKSLFNVEVCGLYCEEHPNQPVTSYTIPFHIDRLAERFSIEIYQPHISEYLKSYSFLSDGEKVNAFNNGIKGLLDRQDIRRDIEMIKKDEHIIQNVSSKVTSTITNNQVSTIVEILEVDDEKELPLAPEGKKYFVCIGGNKNFQGFLSDNRMSKGEFILSHEGELDDSLKPIFSDKLIAVRQDAKYAIPGFYIVSPRTHYRRIDEMPHDLFERCMMTARKVRNGLLNLGIDQAHIYHDEKYKSPTSVHFWILPIHKRHIEENNLNPTILSQDIWEYLEKFPRFKITKSKIIEFNNKMKQFLLTNELKDKSSED